MAPRVLLAVMPFLALNRAALGVSALKSECRRQGIDCDVRYFTFEYAETIGLRDYQRIALALPTHDLCGEWLFSPAAFGEAPGVRSAERFLREIVGPSPEGFYDRAFVSRLLRLRADAASFVARCADTIELADYDIVGATSTFQQNTPSIALLRELKRRKPDVITMLGGANADGEMGPAWVECLDDLDIAVSGEGDLVLPELIHRLRAGRVVHDLPGVTSRGPTGVVRGAPPRPVADLDARAVPDFSDFFDAVAAFSHRADLDVELSVETSRGCWWGQRHHCTFCGLNGTSMAYRRKSPARAYDELRELSSTWGVRRFFASDNIVDPRYFDTVFRWLADGDDQLDLQYEMKSTLRRAQLRVLRDSGSTWFQPGIESLSTHVLHLMDKGVRAIHNVQALKWGRELGFRITWNILCGFPGETAEDYRIMTETMRHITHLEPPASFARFRIDRFSPVFDDPAAHGFSDVVPDRAYSIVFPFPDDRLHRLAYFFEGRRAPEPGAVIAAHESWEFFQTTWKAGYGNGSLTARVSDHLVLVEDTRPGWPRSRGVLTGLDRAVLLAADGVQTVERIAAIVDEREPAHAPHDPAGVERAVARLVDRGWMLAEDDLVLSLPLFTGCDDHDLGARPARVAAPPMTLPLSVVSAASTT